jgi:hypothetical protein
MKCPIKFKFSAGKVNEQVMFLKIIAHEQILFDSTVQETFEVSAEIDFPVDVEFWISGKHPSDTIVRDGQVVEDKFIKLDLKPQYTIFFISSLSNCLNSFSFGILLPAFFVSLIAAFQVNNCSP